MQKQKLIKLLFLFLVLASLLPTACTKRHEEDPWTMKFISLKSRLKGEWHMKKILIDEQDFSHLIEMENDTFFSVYTFTKISIRAKTPYIDKGLEGYLELQTLNKKFLIDRFVLPPILFYLYINKKESKLVIRTGKLVPNFGPINNFYHPNSTTALSWEILKLTPKEMHLQTTYNSQEYDIYFEKK
jgi:hypothetical protein